MTVEEIDLLYTDLCARIPYGVAYHWKGRTGEDDMPHYLNGMNEWMIFYIQQGFVKPYLRPLSSMTEEEKIELKTITKGAIQTIGLEDIVVTTDKGFDWLNEHHFDYRRLIEKGLAIAVTEENNPYKED